MKRLYTWRIVATHVDADAGSETEFDIQVVSGCADALAVKRAVEAHYRSDGSDGTSVAVEQVLTQESVWYAEEE